MITTKTKMYRYLKKGLFGNTNKFYNTFKDIPENKNVVLRWNQPSNIKKCYHSISKKEIKKLNIDFNDITICDEPENNSKCIFNGELTRNQYGLNLRYKIGIMWMRPAMKNPDRAIGLKAKIILEQYLNPSDYDCIMDLLDIYQDHVIEFSIFEGYVGNIPNRNTIIWEVRHY